MNVLSGATVSLDPNDIRVGTSFDQILAKRTAARRRCLVWCSASSSTNCVSKTDLDDLWSGDLWASPTKPATKEIYPSRAFDALVGDGKGVSSTAAFSMR